MTRVKRLKQATALLVGLITVDVSAQEVSSWLDLMNQAVEELNYKGTFVHLLDGNAETLQIVHRNDAGRISERIVSLDGVGREIIREQDKVQCVFPDRREVVLDETRDASPLVAALPSYSEELEPHYEFTIYKTDRVADRLTQKIGIKPKDEFRYGYVLWLDDETAMPLKSQLIDETGKIVEQIQFTQFEIFDLIPESELVSTIDTEGFTWSGPGRSSSPQTSQVPWRASMLPGGFSLSVAEHSPIAGSELPVEHLVYSDGLATVSVFIEDPNNKADLSDGFSKLGSTNVYSLTLNGRKVTAMGEVPRKTVHRIASSLSAE